MLIQSEDEAMFGEQGVVEVGEVRVHFVRAREAWNGAQLLDAQARILHCPSDCASALQAWSKQVFRKRKEYIAALEKDLDHLDEAVKTPSTRNRLAMAQLELTELLRQEELR
ncbi:hypothetical protein Salat_2773100 [Sesamum alatum]|uniref:Uncharacterized protein n=1 Tax=Sesamum alatum TaxID=300844 RepID=A0AAE1XKX1_9LAMI|nr:hypothetical protein Salat_2773100 [Sesamum alatum]